MGCCVNSDSGTFSHDTINCTELYRLKLKLTNKNRKCSCEETNKIIFQNLFLKNIVKIY